MKTATRTFCAGSATADITPNHPTDLYMAGYQPNRFCQGVRDPLWARAVFVTDGHTPLLLIVLDLIGLSLPRAERIQSLISDKYRGSILLICTHNHQGPDTLGLWGPTLFDKIPFRTGLNTRYMQQLEESLIQVTQEALSGCQPASLRLGQAPFDPNNNLIHNPRSQQRQKLVKVLQFIARQSNQTIATVVQHACHPVSLGKSNRHLSADFPAVCCQLLQERFGGTGIYINGEVGAMVTSRIPPEADATTREQRLQQLGTALADTAYDALTDSKPIQIDAIDIQNHPVHLPADGNRFYSFIHDLGLVEKRDTSKGLVSQVNLGKIGPVSFVGLPGEASPELAQEILSRVPGEMQLMFGLTNDELGYLMPPEFFFDPRYAYERTRSPGRQAAWRLGLAIEYLKELQDLHHPLVSSDAVRLEPIDNLPTGTS